MAPSFKRILIQRSCAPHSNDSSGKNYDSNGQVCAAMSAEDKTALIGAMGFCGAVVLVLLAIYGHRWYKSKRREQTSQLEVRTGRPMSSMGSPLIQSTWRDASLSTRSIPPARYPSSPLIGSGSSADSHESSGSSTPYSIASPRSDNFHFPILSADGHLLPAPPASSRQSWTEVSQDDLGGRPLPSPPALSAPILAPVPKNPQRWSYISTYDGTGRPAGLFSGMEIRGDGSVEVLREDRDIEKTGIMSSPTISRVDHSLGSYEPQSATYHQTYSAEGDDYSIYGYGSDDGYRRY